MCGYDVRSGDWRMRMSAFVSVVVSCFGFICSMSRNPSRSLSLHERRIERCRLQPGPDDLPARAVLVTVYRYTCTGILVNTGAGKLVKLHEIRLNQMLDIPERENYVPVYQCSKYRYKGTKNTGRPKLMNSFGTSFQVRRGTGGSSAPSSARRSAPTRSVISRTAAARTASQVLHPGWLK